MAFPQHRPRRLRTTPALRRLVAETRLGIDDLVAPLFVREGISEPQPIASLPGTRRKTTRTLPGSSPQMRRACSPPVKPSEATSSPSRSR